MDRRDLVLAVLGAAQGHSYTPAQLQKAVFLISEKLPGIVDAGPAFNFRPYDYGPFDRSVYDEADVLAAAGLAHVERFSSNGLRYYSATAEGQAAAEAILQSVNEQQANYVRHVSQWVRSLGFAQLVRSIYEEYPQMRANSIFVG